MGYFMENPGMLPDKSLFAWAGIGPRLGIFKSIDVLTAS